MPLTSGVVLKQCKIAEHGGHVSLIQWEKEFLEALQHESKATQQLARLALAISFLREACLQDFSLSPPDISMIWNAIRDILTNSPLETPPFRSTRSAQGFLAVPICSILKEDKSIDELFRFHVWLPQREPGSAELAIHSHQPYAQSWILVGEGTDHTWKVEPATDISSATHAEYALAWGDGNTTDATYKTHQAFSVVKNTRRFVRAFLAKSTTHKRDMTYSIPSGDFHTSDVSPDILHATIFFFDSKRGFKRDASILGPKDAESFQQIKPDDTSPLGIANLVDAVRSWEMAMESGKRSTMNADWEHAFREYAKALNLAERRPMAELPNSAYYRTLVLGELGCTNRRFGRYDRAKDLLEAALKDMSYSSESIEISGELGVVYRHMNRLQDAKRAFQTQYDTAKSLNAEAHACRAVGNLGMVNYQLSLQHDPYDASLLDEAIKNLEERVGRAQQLRRDAHTQDADSLKGSHQQRQGLVWEAIGLDRLSLCYTLSGDTKKAVDCCMRSQQINVSSTDTTVEAFSRFFYGRALHRDGQHELAFLQLNSAKPCSPAIALCKEPSVEHRQYLQELVGLGVDMGLVDEHGYTALEYAVFNNDNESELLVLQGLEKQLGANSSTMVRGLHEEAKLRKAYRELFQERLRPVLLQSNPGDNLHTLRQAYALALEEDEHKRQMFDAFKFVRYTDFCASGKLPAWNTSSFQTFQSDDNDVNFVIFFSYRWINRLGTFISPDDDNHTQYKRMMEAAEEFLILHPHVNRDKLGVWLVSFPSNSNTSCRI